MQVPKTIDLGDSARQKIIKGAGLVYEAVKSTYSPQSGNVAIEKNWGSPVVSHDGITVARQVILTDPIENMGAQFLIEASDQTNKIAGDGTSATVILGYHILDKASKLMAAGYNPMSMRRGITRAAQDIQQRIDDISKPVEDKDLKFVATISSGSESTGALIADTILKVGKDGGVNVEEYQGTNIEQDIVEGFYWNKGYDSGYMMNEPQTRRAVYEDVFVIVSDKKFRDPSDVVPLLELMNDTDSTKCLIIGDVSGAALEVLVANKMKAGINTVTVSPPPMGNQRYEFLVDVATITDADVLAGKFDMKDLEPEQFGHAERIIVNEYQTLIIGGGGDKNKVDERIKLLRNQVKNETNANNAEKMEQRLAKLAGKIGVIKVGAPTDIDRKELMLRVEDAVFATKAARAEGIVPGGGTTLLKIARDATKGLKPTNDEDAGYKLVYDCLRQPFRQLLLNAGVEDVGFYMKQVEHAADGFGYNVKDLNDDTPIDLLEAGVVDPAKVLKQVVENACSMAGIAITTNAAIAFDRDAMKQMQRQND